MAKKSKNGAPAGVGGEAPASRPQDEQVSRRWFLERMAWVSSAAASGALLAAKPAFGIARSREVSEAAFNADVREQAQQDLTELTLSEAMTLIRRGTITPEDLVRATWNRAEAHNDVIQAYAARPTLQAALAEARRRPAGDARAVLRGIPLAPKDNFYTNDMLTEGGSLVYKGFQPTYDATAVRLMREAGGVIIGKAQMGNLAGGRASVLGTTTPTTRNAWTPDDVRYSPAGSSSGTGAAVAARFAIAGLGTQTGGSVMGPGTAEGLTCIKPTFGRVSLHGVIPLSYTRDHVGAMARNAMDAAILLQVLAQPDPNDPRTLGLPEPPDYVLAATPVRGARPSIRWHTRVGLWPGFLNPGTGGGGGGGGRGGAGGGRGGGAGAGGAAGGRGGAAGGGGGGGGGGANEELPLRQALVAQLEALGAEIVPVLTMPDDFEALSGDPLGGSHGDPTAFFIDELRRDVRNFADRLPRFLNGMLQSADTYVKVQQARCLLAHRLMTQLFNQCDVVLGGSGGFDSAGFPLMCMPIGFGRETNTGNQVPRGVVMGAPPFGEERLIALVAAYQSVTNFHTVRPPDPAA
jgi:Asp-tRNA(Asn)/Glu-tRNA(Gln) amidotransferase A subunit family amidase